MSGGGGGVVLEAGWSGSLPCVPHPGPVFPGQTVPLLLTEPADAAHLRRAARSDRLFCLVFPEEGDAGERVSGPGAGVVCEVLQCAPAVGGEACKGRALYRARVSRLAQWPAGMVQVARVRVLDERLPPAPLYLVRDSALTPWACWVYRAADVRPAVSVLREHFAVLGLRPPRDDASLSCWAAGNLALTRREQLELFSLDTRLRLRREARLAARQAERAVLACTGCRREVARLADTLPMSSEGLACNYANLGGYVHEVLTVRQAAGGLPMGFRSQEFSWFPGYSWTVLTCDQCRTHIGWRFDADRRSLRPQYFYGLCRKYVQPVMHPDAHEHETEYYVV